MERKAFGMLVATLRKEIRNEFDETLTQYDLAELARIPLISLQKIEQGRGVNLSPETILSLAKALKLPTRARQVFFLASLGLPDKVFMKQPLAAQALLDELVQILSQMQTPAFIADAFGDVIVSTPALLEVYDLKLDEIGGADLISQFNLYRFLFAPDFAKQRAMLGESLNDFSHRMILIFKMVSLKHRNHWCFVRLLPELNRFPLFREHWQSPFYHDDDILNTLIPLSLNHPRFGKLNFLSSPQVTVSGYGDLYLYNYLPMDAHTAEACVQIMKLHNATPFQNSAWPKPDAPELVS